MKMATANSMVVNIANDNTDLIPTTVEREIQLAMNQGWTFKTAIPIQSTHISGGYTKNVMLIFVKE